MYVRHLGLRDFRSWTDVDLELSPGRTVFVGSNGNGKTNLVEALWYCATLGSHRVGTDAPLIRAGAERAAISTIVVNEGRELAVDIEITAGRANKGRLNRSPVRSTREVLGAVRAVLFAPEDLALVRGDPGERRRYLDELATVRRPAVAGIRADYDKVLKQRTALLKSASGSRLRSDPAALETLDVWDGHLAAHGAQLMAARLDLVNQLAPEVEKAYQLLAPASRPAAIGYRSSDRPGRPADGGRGGVPGGGPAAKPVRAGGRPSWIAGCAWSVRTATTLSCGSEISRPRGSPATASRGRWHWRCGWPPMNCCAPRAANRS